MILSTNKKNEIYCPVCDSRSLVEFNSYKHKCYACTDCNSVHHKKKSGKYILEYFLPVSMLTKILPRSVSLRLFHAPSEGFPPSDFYDGYKNQSLDPSLMKISQVNQLLDIFDTNNIDIKNSEILDISGGPGVVASELKNKCKKIVVTEYSQISVDAMKNNLDVNAVKFDYLKDNLENILKEKFDIILLRSSIIFCDDLERFLKSLSKLLRPNGYILIQTIVPSLGEVFWWQQMEYKFPIIYSQMVIEKSFYKLGCELIFGFREYGDYYKSVMKRRAKDRLGIWGQLYTWIIDYPMVITYYLIARKSKIPIDQSLRHKFLTQLWRLDNIKEAIMEKPKTLHFEDGVNNHKSPDFYQIYNGFLKNKK